MFDGLTEPGPTKFTASVEGVPRTHSASDLGIVRRLAGHSWGYLIKAVWCIVVALPLALLSLLFGITCVICNRHIWPWQKSTDARYTDNMDAIHEGCCPQLRGIN